MSVKPGPTTGPVWPMTDAEKATLRRLERQYGQARKAALARDGAGSFTVAALGGVMESLYALYDTGLWSVGEEE